MTTVVDGRAIAKEIRRELAERVARLPGPPGFAAVLVGEDPASQIYVRNKRRMCERLGIRPVPVDLPASISEEKLLAEIDRLNADPEVHGILVQLPLPDTIDAQRIAAAVDPRKDVDGLHPRNVWALVRGTPTLAPGTPLGILEILDRSGVEIEGARAVVIGRSEIVGKPVALLLLHRNATVTLCHSRTRDLADVAREADVLIAATGRARMVEGDWIKPGAAVIDVGTTSIDGKLVGDVDFEAARERAGVITPVPGGVGPLTIAMTMRNCVTACEALRAE